MTEIIKNFSLELVAGEGFDPPRLGGNVEILLGTTSQSFNFGDPQNGKYLKFDADSRNPGKLLISFGSWLLSTCMAAAAVSLQVNHLHFFFLCL